MSTKKDGECCRPKQDAVVVEPIAGRYILGEGPHWDSRSQKLYFVDIYGQKVLRWSYKDESITSARVEPGAVSFVLPVKDAPGKFAISCGNKFAIMTWDDDQSCDDVPFEVLATVDLDRDDNRWNDGKVDSSGRFYGGTMASERDGIFKPELGYLYCVGEDAVPKKLESGIGISNGLAWNLEDDTMYYIDSLKHQVAAYDYDRQSGKIDNKRVAYDLKKNNIDGFPDGMTIDSDGNLWIAVYFGSCVLKVNPKTGELLQTIKFPAKRITSVAFGGPQLDILYVTSSAFRMSEAELEEEPLAGYLFRVKGLGVRGLPPNEYKLNKK